MKKEKNYSNLEKPHKLYYEKFKNLNSPNFNLIKNLIIITKLS